MSHTNDQTGDEGSNRLLHSGFQTFIET